MAIISDNISYRIRQSFITSKIVFVNVAIFLLLRILAAIFTLSGNGAAQSDIISLLALPATFDATLTHPWTLITHMFTHFDFLHIIFNMLWLYWFGLIFTDITSSRSLLALYLYGGLIGAATYLGCSSLHIITPSSALLGASAAITAIVVATAVITPHYKMSLLFLGEVSIIWIAAAMVVIDMIGISAGNIGGHTAHIGGIIMGIVYGLCYRRGIDLSRLLHANNPKHHKRKASRQQTTDNRTNNHIDDEEQLNRLLDKIRHSGFSSLTADERNRLFEISSRHKSK